MQSGSHTASEELSKEPLIISRLGQADLDEILEIDLDSKTIPWSRRSYVGELDNPHAHIVGARGSGRLLGFVAYHSLFDEAHILKLAVLTPYRRLGIGAQLLSYALRDARGRGVASAYLEVRTNNHPAINLYRRRGFREIGIRKAYYTDTGEDALVMRLELDRDGDL